MLHKLYIDNGFRHFNRTIEFGKGLTGIIGQNESGKSLIVEFIRFALFGSSALRGKAEDYKKLHVELWFSIRGQEYHVVRKASKVELYRDGDPLASGTKPVNQAVVEALGYDMAVFDVANACNQGNVEALTNMRPAERKAMVDRTIGLNVLDDVIKFCGEQANGKKREADAVARTLVEPVEPTLPEGYQPSADLLERLTSQRDLQKERNQLAGWLQAAPAAPQPPLLCSITETAEELRQHQSARLGIERSIAETEAELKRLKLPSLTHMELTDLDDQWEAYERWQQKAKLLAQGHLCCPSCNHSWPVASDALAAFADVHEAPEPTVSKALMKAEWQLQGNLTKLDELTALLNTLTAKLLTTPDRALDLKQRQDYEASLAQYQSQVAAYELYQSQVAAKQARFDELAGVDAAVESLDALYRAALAYERDMNHWQKAKEAFEAGLTEVVALKAASDEFFEARKRVQDLKIQVKTHLLPSLNKVASVLLTQMTGGERSLVNVDEDFEITIDGQSVNTLSGSGKAVANLAIRIALGQILTNKVFSVFFADEVDASMDEDRAAYTAQALRRLTDLIGQVVIITHKRPETDHMIELTK